MNPKFSKILNWGKQSPSSQSSLPIGDLPMSSSAKPTTVTVYYHNRKEDTMECVYAKPVNGALQVATKFSNSERWQYRYIPFSNSEIDYIVVDSEAKEESTRSSHSHERP